MIASPEDRVIAVKPDRGSATAIFAIDKIERLKPVKEEGWEFTGHLNLGINIESGNTEKQYFHFDADTQIANGPHQIKLFAETTVETNNDVRTDDKQLFNGSYNYFLTKKWFLRTNTMRVLLFWKLFANFQYNFNYNNEPADGKVSNDAKFVTTVGLKW